MKTKIVNLSEVRANKNMSIAPEDYIDREIEKEMQIISEGIHPNFEQYQMQRIRRLAEQTKGMADLIRERGITVQKLSADYMHQIVDDITCNLGDVMRKEQEKRESMLLDMHLEKAKEMFNTDLPTKEQRAEAKRWNFHEMYGGRGVDLKDFIEAMGGMEMLPYQEEFLNGLKKGQVVVVTGRTGVGKSMRVQELFEAYRRTTEVYPVEQLPLEILEKNAKKLRTRIRKEKNPGIQKSLRKELAELEKEIYELK